MILGILSDTHGHVDAMAAAMKLLKQAGAGAFIHCGDVGSTAVLDFLAGEQAWFVFGNTDLDHTRLESYARTIGVTCLKDFGIIELQSRRIGVFHGDDIALYHQLIAQQQLDYLLQGHTHESEDRTVGKIRLINPGALFRARIKSVATLDLTTDTLKIRPLADL